MSEGEVSEKIKIKFLLNVCAKLVTLHLFLLMASITFHDEQSDDLN